MRSYNFLRGNFHRITVVYRKVLTKSKMPNQTMYNKMKDTTNMKIYIWKLNLKTKKLP